MDFVELFQSVFGGGGRLKYSFLLLKFLNELLLDSLHCALEIIRWCLLFGHTPKSLFARIETEIKHISEIWFPIEGWNNDLGYIWYLLTVFYHHKSTQISPLQES